MLRQYFDNRYFWKEIISLAVEQMSQIITKLSKLKEVEPRSQVSKVHPVDRVYSADLTGLEQTG